MCTLLLFIIITFYKIMYTRSAFFQVILPLLQTDLYQVMQACVKGNLNSMSLNWKVDVSMVAVIMASGGYPGSYEKGKKITGSDINVNYSLRLRFSSIVLLLSLSYSGLVFTHIDRSYLLSKVIAVE